MPANVFSDENALLLPPGGGQDHAALAILPFTVADGDQAPQTFSYQMPVDGKIRRVDVTLEAVNDKLPGHHDQHVFLALLQLALRSADEPTHRMAFRKVELIDLLGLPRRGDSYRRIRDSLNRLSAVRITIRSAMLARDGREYHKEERATHIIDSYRVSSRRDADCWIEWGHVVREAFRLGDFKRLDWHTVLALGNPLTAQIYRVLDRVTMSGEERWEIGWKPLASALGMRADAYSRPARFRQVLEPHLESLMEQGVIDSYDYQRGGTFVFHVRNYLRAQLRKVLEQLGVYAEAARQLVAGHDETVVMSRTDCHQHGQNGGKLGPGALVSAIREVWDLRYPDDEPQAFLVLWEHLSELERQAFQAAGLKLCGVGESLFDTRRDPTAWSLEMRAVVRFMVCWAIDAEQV